MNIRVPSLLYVLFTFLDACVAMKWHECSETPFTPHSVTLKPDPPQIGQKISFDIVGTYDPDGAR